MTFRVVIEPGEDGYLVVHCPSLKGCWSQGRTRDEALANIREAIALYLEPEGTPDVATSKGREVVDLTF